MKLEKELLKIFLISVFFVYILKCEDYQTVQKRLLNKLLTDYDRTILPNETVGAFIMFYLRQIVSMDEKNQILTSSSYFSLFWRDYRLSWNPVEFGNVRNIKIPIRSIWIPDLFIINSADTDGF